MDSPWMSLVAFALMLAAVGLGALIRRRWPEHHSNRETIELLQSTVLTLATFAAIVLGLLITSAKTDYDDIENDIRSFSSTLVQLNYSLEELGPAGAPLRQQLARYAASAIAATWTDQAPPAGAYYPRLPRVGQADAVSSNAPILGQMLEQVDCARCRSRRRRRPALRKAASG
jgi:NADH:ubiquinone oxidoreductase subunit 5 (subunit L)/multisubunit Na+/H+ antiporter MnhA subunit